MLLWLETVILWRVFSIVGTGVFGMVIRGNSDGGGAVSTVCTGVISVLFGGSWELGIYGVDWSWSCE